MATYLGIYSLFSVISLSIPDRKSLPVFVVLGLFLFWFMGYRYYVGCDYFGYLHRWINTPIETNWLDLLTSPEPGFNGLTAFMRQMGYTYNALLAACSAILVMCYVTFARAHTYSLTIFAMLFPVIILQLGMSGVRQAIAGGFLMLASLEFMEKRKLRTGLWILAGMQFHASVVMFLPMALLAGRTVSTLRLAMALGVLGPVAALFLADRADVYSGRYIEGNVVSGGAIIRYALIMIPVVVMPIYRRELREMFPKVYPLLKLFVLICFALAPLMVLSSIALHRLNYYVMPFSIILFTYLVPVIFPPAQRTTGRLIPIGAYGMYSLMWFMTSRHADYCYIPYSNVTLTGG